MLGTMLRELLKTPEVAAAKSASATVDHTQATVVFADSDRYSIALQTLKVASSVAVGEDTQAFLSTTAAAIARELGYLEEPLAVWELAGDEGVAQLRSTPPQREGEQVSYWEVELHAVNTPFATLTRYRWTPELLERELVEYPATFALVGRIVNSLNTALTL